MIELKLFISLCLRPHALGRGSGIDHGLALGTIPHSRETIKTMKKFSQNG